MQERRRFPRVIAGGVLARGDRAGHGVFDLTIHNLSLGGILAESSVPLEVGDHVRLLLQLEDRTVRVLGCVARIQEEESIAAKSKFELVGVEFQSLSREVRKIIEEFVEAHSLLAVERGS